MIVFKCDKDTLAVFLAGLHKVNVYVNEFSKWFVFEAVQ